MPRPAKENLRALTDDERAFMEALLRSRSSPIAQVTRAKALLAVADGKSFTQAGRACGLTSGDAVARWVARFNLEGVKALVPRRGGGAKARYTSEDRQRIVQEVRRVPHPHRNGATSWSLSTLQRSLRRKGLPAPSIYTLRQILREAGVDWRSRIGKSELNGNVVSHQG